MNGECETVLPLLSPVPQTYDSFRFLPLSCLFSLSPIRAQAYRPANLRRRMHLSSVVEYIVGFVRKVDLACRKNLSGALWHWPYRRKIIIHIIIIYNSVKSLRSEKRSFHRYQVIMITKSYGINDLHTLIVGKPIWKKSPASLGIRLCLQHGSIGRYSPEMMIHQFVTPQCK